jgi:hypothetical protein
VIVLRYVWLWEVKARLTVQAVLCTHTINVANSSLHAAFFSQTRAIINIQTTGYQPATTWVHCTASCKHSLVLLRVEVIITQNMLSWLELIINHYCCIYLVVYIIYMFDYLQYFQSFPGDVGVNSGPSPTAEFFFHSGKRNERYVPYEVIIFSNSLLFSFCPSDFQITYT